MSHYKLLLIIGKIDFDDAQVSLRQFSLSLNDYQVMMGFFKFWPENIKKVLITLQALRLKLNRLNQTGISSILIMQITKTFSYN